MSSADERPGADEQVPTLSTAPVESAPRRRRVPSHLGPLRLSTVLLAVAFVAVGVLYLFVKPPEARTAGDTSEPAPTTQTTPRTTAPGTDPTGEPTAPTGTPPEVTTPDDGLPGEEPTDGTEPTAPEETLPPEEPPPAEEPPAEEPAPTGPGEPGITTFSPPA